MVDTLEDGQIRTGLEVFQGGCGGVGVKILVLKGLVLRTTVLVFLEVFTLPHEFCMESEQSLRTPRTVLGQLGL